MNTCFFKLYCISLQFLTILCEQKRTTEDESIETFHKTLTRNIAKITADKTEGKRMMYIVFHLMHRECKMKEFFDLYAKLNESHRPNNVVTIMTVKRCKNSKEEQESEYSIEDFIISIHNHLKNKERGYVRRKNVEVMVSTILYDRLHDFDVAEQFFRNKEKIYGQLDILTSRAAVDEVKKSFSQVMLDYLTKEMHEYVFYEVIRPDYGFVPKDDHLITLSKTLLESLIKYVEMDEIKKAMTKFVTNTDRKITIDETYLKDISDYQKRIEFEYFKDDDQNAISWMLKNCKERIPALVHLFLEKTITETLDSLKNTFNSIDQFTKMVSKVHDKLVCHINSDLNNLKKTDCEGFVKLLNNKKELREAIHAIFDSFFTVTGHKRFIRSIASDIKSKIISDTNKKLHNEKHIRIVCSGAIRNVLRSGYIFDALNTARVFENMDCHQLIYIDRPNSTSCCKIQCFYKQYNDNKITLSDQRQYMPSSAEVLNIYHTARRQDDSIVLAKYLMQRQSNDKSPIITEVYGKSNENINIRYTKENHKRLNNINEIGLPKNVFRTLFEHDSSQICNSIDCYRIRIADRLIIIFTKLESIKDTKEFCILYNVPELHLISEDCQLFEPVSLSNGVSYIQNLPYSFLEHLLLYLQIVMQTGRVKAIRDIYITPLDRFYFAEDVITYHDKVIGKELFSRKNAIGEMITDAIFGVYESKMILREHKIHSFTKSQLDFDSCVQKDCGEISFKDHNNITPDVFNDAMDQLGLNPDRLSTIWQHHARIMGPNIIFYDVKIYRMSKDNKSIAFFIVGKEYAESIDPAFANLPMVILSKLLRKTNRTIGNRCKCSASYMPPECLIIEEIYKHEIMDRNWHHDKEKKRSRKYLKTSCLGYLSHLNQSKVKTDQRTSVQNDTIRVLVNALLIESVKITTVFASKPTSSDILCVKNFKMLLAERMKIVMKRRVKK